MSVYRLDELVESQDFEYDQLFVQYENYHFLEAENDKLKKQLEEAEEIIKSFIGLFYEPDSYIDPNYEKYENTEIKAREYFKQKEGK